MAYNCFYLRYFWEILEIHLRYVWHPEICQRFTLGMPNIYLLFSDLNLEYTWDILGIYLTNIRYISEKFLRYTSYISWHIPEMFLTYTQDLLYICQTHTCDIPDIYLKYTLYILEIYTRYCNLFRNLWVWVIRSTSQWVSELVNEWVSQSVSQITEYTTSQPKMSAALRVNICAEKLRF